MKNTLEKQDFETSQIPNELILDSDLSTKALRIWMLIYLKKNDWQFSIKDLTENFVEGRILIESAAIEFVNSAVIELEKRGYLRKNNLGKFELSAISYEKEKDLKGEWDFAYQLIEPSDLSIRSYRGIQDFDVRYIGELVVLKGNHLLKTANFGPKSLEEIKQFLSTKGLKLETKIPYFVLEKIKSLKEKPFLAKFGK